MLIALRQAESSEWSVVEDVSDVSDIRAQPGSLLWAEMDVAELDPTDFDPIAEEFGLHELAVEDALKTRQRPKLERYENHLFMVAHQLDEIEDQLEARQISCFIGRRYLLVIHEGADRLLKETKQRWQALERDVRKGVPFLVHTLLDTLVDDYQAKADELENDVEELEEVALSVPQVPIERQLYSLKQQLARLRRYALPVGRSLDWIVNGSARELLPPQTTEYFRDIHDHLLRITEQVHNIDELSQAVLDLQRAEQAEALNEINKKLSAWAAIFAVGTLIAGVYGMNFELVPPSGSGTGFWFAIALTIACGIGLYWYFRRRKWL